MKQDKSYQLSTLDQVFFGLLLGFAAWLLFSNISTPPIRIWDEAIYVNNAIEMSRSGDLLVLKNDGVNSLYNVKPPLVIWLQSLSINIFGINEFAVRLPSTLAAIVVLWSLFWFSFKVLRRPIIGTLAGFTLLLSAGYFRFHVVRTGDLDSVLVAFITLYTLRLLAFLIQDKHKDPRQAIIWTSVFVTLAFFSKSFAALLPLPGLLLAVLLSNKRKQVLTSKYLYLSMLGAGLSVVLYYGIRELLAPGYFEIVYNSEVKRIFSNIMPYHNHPFGWYFINWFDNWLGRPYFLPFIYLTFLSLPLLVWKNWTLSQRRCIKLLWVWCLAYFLMISTPAVKLEWYDAPLFPMMALLAAFTVDWLVQRLQFLPVSKALKILFTLAFLVGIFSNALEKTLIYVKSQPALHEQEYAGAFMKSLVEKQIDLKAYTIIFEPPYPEHLDQAKFYQKAFNLEQGYTIDLEESLENISVRDTILTCQVEKLDSIAIMFDFQILAEDEHCKVLYLESAK